ncbi:solute carrier family 53 member 1 [Onthophagus taurus]|uniref:solute carrier family 53 member 1 n=1 Tax=Onthophagus taurus TaxID=166361 RepID=UPI000C20548E|nr:xenotropic and polytropic retrovirus receptor 1 homolog isoform X1 [Onthophagus taurus]XP_022905041.1 xenotropic and polytropic retrovirus receptor 1 homolog isoform X2 [Onthophagus taurus]XP_022905043.1 xenotropic and polytropic retrovirus receptor 1 homolog isoform X3 [Onthophagus taurus]
MKFAEHLSAHITPEWRKQYINYEEMKQLLYSAVEQAPSSEHVEPDVFQRYFAKFDEEFFHYCDKELAKINTFYSEKLAEATRKYASLRSEIIEIQSDNNQKKSSTRGQKLLRKKNVPLRKLQELKLAFSEFYLSLILLQNYQNLNFTGFRKILKKHDKLLSSEVGARWRVNHVENSHFYMNKDIDRIIRETESTVTQYIEGGDRQRAMKRLRVPPLGEKQSPWITFKVGLFTGSFTILLVTVILSGIFRQGKDDWRVACRLYRGPLLIILSMFLWGVNIYGWRSSGVNHVLIFELDPRNHLSEQHVIEMASIFGVVWTLSVLSFIYSTELGIPAYVNPLVLFGLMLAFLLNPTKTFRHAARFWALKVLGRILLAPFFYVNFADFWMADQLVSLIPLFSDIQFIICFYISIGDWYTAKDWTGCVEKRIFLRLFIACLPPWFRFAQCLRRYRDTREAFPHLANAAKYATSFFVMTFTTLLNVYSDNYQSMMENPFFYFWISSSLISSCYAYTWDIKLDWGLLDSKAGDNKFLREEVVYSSTWFYYFAIIEDFILRFGWAFSMSLTELGYVHGDLMVTILAPLEIFRRFVWNYFRLENEHLNNCGKFRAVRDISVAPMDCSDQMLIIRMMDEDDGVINRKKKRIKRKQEQRLMLEGESTDDVDN